MLLAWLVMTLIALGHGLWALTAMTTLQAGAMAVGAWLAVRSDARRATLMYDALAAGVLLASACVYVVPGAISGHAVTGCVGMSAGLIIGLTLHWARHTPRHRSMLGALWLHALTAGLVLGVVYTSMPALGLSLGLAIVAHKLPAGYALARTLRDEGRSSTAVILPACAVGLACLPIARWPLAVEWPPGLLFGLASGLFLSVSYAYTAQLPWRAHSGRAVFTYAIAGAAIVVIISVASNAGGWFGIS